MHRRFSPQSPLAKTFPFMAIHAMYFPSPRRFEKRGRRCRLGLLRPATLSSALCLDRRSSFVFIIPVPRQRTVCRLPHPPLPLLVWRRGFAVPVRRPALALGQGDDFPEPRGQLRLEVRRRGGGAGAGEGGGIDLQGSHGECVECFFFFSRKILGCGRCSK